ncbi:uncharacterized protein EI90DRAFT_3089620 [Cantharellus anzutake]|uniref:uncharacterized protein n=1 Tax=Cantharellus anzutake TaxID=1750568 RepID=UPI001905C97E|nr:uncharacterized protein EI90DRAFT_3089620 [Cantharellus anzutake]KAF8314608.1 hypothetical protein EI90DRAFT_3089620 [Cantharellus anzutake]
MFQVITSAVATYRIQTRHFGVLPSTTVWYDTVYQISLVICSTVVQLYFAFRLYRFSGSIWLSALVVLCTLGQVGTGLAIWIKANVTHELESFIQPIRHVVITWLTLEAVADLVIAFAMSYFLQKRRTGFRPTDTVLRKLAVYAINTGLLTRYDLSGNSSMNQPFSYSIIQYSGIGHHVCLRILRLPLHPADIRHAAWRCLYILPFG